MKYVFIVPGYGVPADISADLNYSVYLRTVFNRIFEAAAGKPALVVFSGGPTDMRRPYRRTEAGEMLKFFRGLCARPAVRKRVRGWKLAAEKRSISTLENLVFSRGLLERRGFGRARPVVFCERTRAARMALFALRVWRGKSKYPVSPVDFDQSENRFLDPSFIAEKERREARLGILALENEDNFRELHALYAEKLRRLRRAGLGRHVKEIRSWWEERLGRSA